MINRLFWLMTLLVAPLLLAACGGVLAQPESAALKIDVTNLEGAEEIPAAQEAEKYGLLAGPVDDKGFNQLAWEGLQRAGDELGVEVNHLETDEDNVAENINQFVEEGHNGVVAVGIELGLATEAASLANLDIPFVSIDFPSQTAGDLGVLFSTDEPAFMAGYLAAGMTQTGTVCTYGGRQTPPVMIFMVGFEHGVKYYNEQNGAQVQVLGWRTDPSMGVGGEGAFVGNFDNQADGRTMAEDFFNQGCDIIFPVAGAVGLGSAAVARERGLTVIGVDADQTQTVPEYQDVYLTSVLKKIDAAVFEAIRQIHEGTYEGGVNFIGTLTNKGVGLAPYHNFEAKVPPQLKDELARIEQGIVDGAISTGWPIMQAGISSAVEARLTPQLLQNAVYPSEFTQNGTAPLVNGEYREPAAPGSATETLVQLSDMVAYGDLDDDGFEDAAVVLISDPGGSGTFYHMTAVLDRRGQPTPVATAYLGDRIEINSLAIQNGEIVIEMLTQGPNDSLAGPPTQAETRKYRIKVSLEQASAPVFFTEVVNYTPTEIPTDTQSGSCFGNAVGLGREDAYRCMVDNQIYDPCFVVDDTPTVVCGANPTTGETGFVLELTEPLPAPEVGNLSMPWLVELADGTVCGLMTGTVVGVGDRTAGYGCPDGTYLFNDFQQGQVWMAEKAVIDLGDDGFVVTESEMVPIRTVWQ